MMRPTATGSTAAPTTTGLAAGLAVAAAAGVLLGVVAACPAHAAPVPDPETYVHTIAPGDHIHTIDLGGSVSSLRSQKHVGGKTAVTINSDVLFDFDKATLTSAAKKTLSKLAGKLRHATATIQVDGYTDSKGSGPYNRKLSTRRAAAVRTYLMPHVRGTSIKAVGHGEAHPVAPNRTDGHDNPDGRAKNRRVTIRF